MFTIKPRLNIVLTRASRVLADYAFDPLSAIDAVTLPYYLEVMEAINGANADIYVCEDGWRDCAQQAQKLFAEELYKRRGGRILYWSNWRAYVESWSTTADAADVLSVMLDAASSFQSEPGRSRTLLSKEARGYA